MGIEVPCADESMLGIHFCTGGRHIFGSLLKCCEMPALISDLLELCRSSCEILVNYRAYVHASNRVPRMYVKAPMFHDHVFVWDTS